jgi:hypothetical protein
MLKSAWIILMMCLGPQLMWSQDAVDAAVKSKLVALERVAKIQAFETKDMRTLDSMLDEGFVAVASDGKLQSKGEFMIFVQAADRLHYQLDSMDVRFHNSTAIVTGLFQMKDMVHGKRLLQSGRFVDSWLFKDGTWVLIASLSTPAS